MDKIVVENFVEEQADSFGEYIVDQPVVVLAFVVEFVALAAFLRWLVVELAFVVEIKNPLMAQNQVYIDQIVEQYFLDP